ncbi:hypothetical protein BK004_03655 [bacterium CG10_46_32]|uniref:HTH cro/C1-type domain-containing protein n=1 Tax=Candidatus Campbellbacteria bacterium CG22_combo_CG10-13_8_21_14_all_43_18 TaxID=1974530 RepID=A0A2H0DVU7_9BACT|nr:MAG: hypothetical protein BK004_03655 [bacterium CG10_46_32]PIP86302.1 MAG: hypothetical protein COW82_02790 [Candidatus Campbellbacteria bacterium CG22_combo_CG10-13_8_21_14_all_43_18]PIR55894.1 MAG: hypothetical protein COU73_03685 [Parcubacteria group bacterium CG10_big_fil_rev_8_21_14_0_10_46_32]
MNNTIYSKGHKQLIEKLKNARIEIGLDQVEVAERLNKTQSYISKVESGQRRIDIIQLKEFAKLYKKDIHYFIN